MNRKILLVDDSKAIRILAKRALRTKDVTVIEAGNGVEGLQTALQEMPDLIMLDITMPEMGGLEMLEKLRSDPAGAKLTVIILTAEGGREMMLKAAQLGTADYIIKPFEPDALLQKIEKVLPLDAAPAAQA